MTENNGECRTLSVIFLFLCTRIGYFDSEVKNKICISSDGKKYYVGTHLGLYVVDAKTREPLKKEAIDYGVHDIAEISPGTIAVSTWTGVKVFETSD